MVTSQQRVGHATNETLQKGPRNNSGTECIRLTCLFLMCCDAANTEWFNDPNKVLEGGKMQLPAFDVDDPTNAPVNNSQADFTEEERNMITHLGHMWVSGCILLPVSARTAARYLCRCRI